MDAQQFLAEFEHIASAPEGVQRLRELILQLAITGALTQRIDRDTPASVLFKQNQQALAVHHSERQIKRQHAPSAFDNKDVPWILPEGWVWCRLGQVSNYGQAPKADYSDVSEDTWVLELEDIEKSSSRLLQRVRAKDRKFLSTKNGFSSGAVLYGKLRPYLDKVLIADEPGVCTTEIIPITFFHEIDGAYLRWYLKSPYFVSYASNSTHGMNLPRMGTDAARDAFFPFPPKQEQTRIVAKVDELMALCDKLEAQQQELSKFRQLARIVAFEALINSESCQEFRDAWARVEANIPNLIRQLDDVSHLRSVILNFASNGFLDGVHEGDSDATKLLGSISAIQQKEFTNRELKELRMLPSPIVLDRHHIRLSLGHIVKVVSGQHLVPGEYNTDGKGIPYITGPAEFGAHFPEPNKWTTTKRAVATEGDILLTVKGAGVGKTSTCNFNELAISRQLMAVRALGEVDRQYLAICVDAARHKFQAQKFGIAIPGIGREEVLSLEILLPSREEQARIVEKSKRLMGICDSVEKQLSSASFISEKLSISAVSAITGIRPEEEEEPLKAPKTELVSRLHLLNSPSTKEQAPLAAILARHHDEMAAGELWQRFGGDIDAFYAQLKLEIAKGWIAEPAVAKMREVEAG